MRGVMAPGRVSKSLNKDKSATTDAARGTGSPFGAGGLAGSRSLAELAAGLGKLKKQDQETKAQWGAASPPARSAVVSAGGSWTPRTHGLSDSSFLAARSSSKYRRFLSLEP